MPKKALGPTTNLYPMPTLLLAVRTGEDSANILTIAWAGIVGNGPALLALRIGGFHYSAPFIDREMSFTVNIPSSRQAVGADYCGLVSGQQDPDKAATCGWTLLPATHIASPIIAECPLNMECRVVHKHPIGRGAIYIAEILETHVDEEVLDEEGEIDAALLDPLIFAPPRGYYRLGERVGTAWELGRALQRAPSKGPQ
jgi:flavin reductase (DIM6/NTAB) family NADH-FMN oxidoreductase RutF